MKLDLDKDELVEFLGEASRLAAERFMDIRRGRLNPELPMAEIRGLFDQSLPVEGAAWTSLLARVEREIFANSVRSTSPDFYSLVTSSGSPFGIAGEILAAGLNQVAVRENIAPAAAAIEAQVLRWIAQFIGFGHEEGGVLVSGGSAGNLVALMAARTARGPEGVARRGLATLPQMTVYTSTELHLCLDKAVDLIGLGREHLKKIPVAQDFRIRLDLLAESIAADRAGGLHPLAVVAQGGSVNTGTVDDLEALADLCAAEGLWLHVDGAYGAPAAGTVSGRGLFAGLNRVDSIAIDAHKWLYVPFTAGCVLVKDPTVLRRSFSVMADYAESSLEDARTINFMERGLQMSRSFTALKVWMTLAGFGSRVLRDSIEENIQTMRHLGRLLQGAEDFELLIPVRLSIVCFRYLPAGLDPDRDGSRIDAVNEAIFERAEAEGRVGIGRVTIMGVTALRACCVKYRTEREHVEHLLSVVREMGQEVADRAGANFDGGPADSREGVD